MRRRALAGASALGAATAATALVVGSATGFAQETGTSSAYAIGAGGLVNIAETPYVESTDGSEVEETAVNIPGDNPLQDLLEVNVGSVSAAENEAGVRELDVTLLNPADGIPGLGDTPLLELTGLTLTCDGDSSELEIGSLEIAGEGAAIPGPDEEVSVPEPLSDVLNITAHAQGETADGDYTAQGLVVEVLSNDIAEEFGFEDGALTLTLASVTCGGPADDDNGDNGNGDNGDDDDDKDDDKPTATKPAPTETDLPVTG